MPLFVVQALDAPDALPRRLEHYSAHRAFVETEASFGLSIVLSGPLQSDDGATMIGSFFLIDAPSRAEVAAFTEADPFRQEAVWQSVSIIRFHRRRG